MDLSVLKLITIIAFIIVIAIFAVVSLMGAYIFIRYGRSKGITIFITLVFGTLFAFAAISSYLILQTIF